MMRYICFVFLYSLLIISCSTKSDLVYINDFDANSYNKIKSFNINDKIVSGDILNIDVFANSLEAALPYNKKNASQVPQNIDLMRIDGYLVNDFNTINFPVLGKINVFDLTNFALEDKISNLLIEGGHLINPKVKVRKINSKFTILGEVKNPGTFSFFDNNLNLFQALGYAGDITIEGKRKSITLVREENGLRKFFKIDLTEKDFLSDQLYYIKNNDVIIIEPNFSKVKSAGFIGSPASIASISSLLLSITLLIINR